MISNQHPELAERSAFLSYLTEVAAGYCWSAVRYSVLFGTTLQSLTSRRASSIRRPEDTPQRRTTQARGIVVVVVVVDVLVAAAAAAATLTLNVKLKQ